MTDLSTGKANWIVGSTLGLFVFLIAIVALTAIGGAIEQAYEAGYADAQAGRPHQ